MNLLGGEIGNVWASTSNIVVKDQGEVKRRRRKPRIRTKDTAANRVNKRVTGANGDNDVPREREERVRGKSRKAIKTFSTKKKTQSEVGVN